MAGWDIALQLDEDPRLGNNLVECLEYVGGTRVFVLVDVALAGLEGMALAARIRGVIHAHGILAEDPVHLLDTIFRELAQEPEQASRVGVMLAEVQPGGSDVQLVIRNHPGALLLRSKRPRDGLREDRPQASPGEVFTSDGGLQDALVSEAVVSGAAVTATVSRLHLEPREAVLLISRFASQVGDSVALRESRHADLARMARELVDGGSSTAIDGIVSLSSSLRQAAGSDWPNRLLSIVWIRRAAIVV